MKSKSSEGMEHGTPVEPASEFGFATAEDLVEPAPQVAEVKTAEDWARARGHFPEFIEQRDTRNPERRLPPRHNQNYRLYRQAFFTNGWVQGKEMTAAEYDEAVAKADDPNNHVFR